MDGPGGNYSKGDPFGRPLEYELSYDDLVLATGVQTDYFGNDAWVPYALGLKSLDDALDIRRRVLLAFEDLLPNWLSQSARRAVRLDLLVSHLPAW